MSDFALQLVEDMEFDVLIAWADILTVPHDENQWLDDEYPDKTDELRVAVADAMGKVEK